MRKATWQTAALAGQVTAWTEFVCDRLRLGPFVFGLVMAPVFFSAMVWWVMGGEFVGAALGRRDSTVASEIGGRMGARMLVWFASGATVIAIVGIVRAVRTG